MDSPANVASLADAENRDNDGSGSGDHGGPIVKTAVAPPGPWA